MEKELLHKIKFECIQFTLFDIDGKSREYINLLRDEFIREFDNGIYHYWIDMTHVKMVNSVFIGVIAFMSTMVEDKGEIVIFGSNENIEETIKITNILKLPNICLSVKPPV